ncbi:MAG: YdaU family protein [Candidatus Thiodiazotropha sp. (ex Troendleina suluensis)]|nr:YdaU family protein [Candidatus Thiodiazotropha sp. (ex Troendleina suluensis)]
MNYYMFHIGDYATAAGKLTLMEDLAYRRLLDLYYSKEGDIPNDPERVARLLGMRNESESVSYILSEFFLKSENKYKNARCDEEITKYKAKANRAKKANEIRWGLGKDLKSDLTSDTDKIATNNQEKKKYIKKKISVPHDFAISDRVRTWAEKNHHTNLEQHLENFVLTCESNSYTYANLDSALMRAIRDDWAKIKNNDEHEPYNPGKLLGMEEI